jgi:hypothetical protein
MAVKVSENRRAGMALVGAVIKPAPGANPATSPHIISGTGVPSLAAPEGSIFLRTDSGNSSLTLYVRAGGAWSALA